MAAATPSPDRTGDPRAALRLKLPLLLGTFVVAISGLVYELIAGTVSSYLLGDSVYQFSLVIGLFMSAMGLGSWLSRYLDDPERAFVAVQTLLGLIGGLSAPLLFHAYAGIQSYEPFLYLTCVAIGALVGLEIPLIARILQRHDGLKVNISNVLTADYVGALVAALLFPLVLVPQLGLMATSLVFGLLNLGVAAMAAWLFRGRLGAGHVAGLAASVLILGLTLAAVGPLTRAFEAKLYGDEVIFAQDTPFQRVVVTRRGERYRLFLGGGLQFDSQDEHRYHEALVHPAMALAPRKASVLILGGGDGMAAREVLRHPGVERVTLVDLDPAVTGLFRDNPDLARLNGGSLRDPRVEVVNADAWRYLEEQTGRGWDVAILDLPDPNDFSVSRLYTSAFYAELARHLPAHGVLVTQATSPLFAREAFWSIEATLRGTPAPSRAGTRLATLPYHATVPSFGPWGFVMASRLPLIAPHAETWGQALPRSLRYLTPATASAMFAFPPDMAPLNVEPNSLVDHALVRYHAQGWGRWYE